MTPAILGAWVRRLQRPVVEIKPMGHFLDLDAEGYLINEASSEKIVEPWKGAVEDVRKAYIENLGPALHSIYLRGSSARGTALQGISDVDTFAVCQGPPDKIPTAWAPDYYHHFMEKFPFANGLDMQFIHLDQLFRGVSHFSYRFIIKVLATCIHGPDLAERIPKFKPSLKIAFFYHGNLRQVLNESLQKIETAEDEEQIRLWSNYVPPSHPACAWDSRSTRTGKCLCEGFIPLVTGYFSKYATPKGDFRHAPGAAPDAQPSTTKEGNLTLLRVISAGSS